jgi:septum formation protein
MGDDPVQLVLASASPRRADLLRAVGLDFTIRPANVDESIRGDESPEVYVERVARAKATAECRDGETVLAADTCVAIDGVILGKPADADDARRMLQLLSGRTHRVHTGVAFVSDGLVASQVVTSDVTFANLSADDIDWYLATREPLDKAGSYGLQGPGAFFVERVDGSPSNVIGLPMHVLATLAAGVGRRLR